MTSAGRNGRRPRGSLAPMIASTRTLLLSLAALGVVTAIAPLARADNAAAAEALFVEGRRLLQEKQLAAACPKLAESYKLDPATGTLLALALCYEGQGRTASAWAAYTEAASRAHNEKNPEREQAAKERAAALEPRLARIAVEIAPGAEKPAGLTITRDGEVVGDGSLGVPIPVDPGEHELTAKAAGKAPIAQKVRVGEGETRRVAVGPFAAAPGSEGPSGDSASPGFFTPLRTVGVAAGAAGVLGLGAAGVLTGLALSKKAESDKDCQGDVCGATGFDVRKDARSLGDGATIALVAGGVLAAAGITLVIVGGPRAAAPPPTASIAPRSSVRPAAMLAPVLAPGALGVSLQGAY